MIEALKNIGVPKEVQIARKWVETDIIGTAVCPPMVALAREHKSSGGGVDWGSMSKFVEISSYFSKDPNSPKLVSAVAEEYYKFMRRCADGADALSHMFILPDFANNPRFDRFARDMVEDTRDRFRTNDGKKVMRKIMIELGRRNGQSQAEVLQLVGGERGSELGIAVVINEAFSPAYFYGHALSDVDIADMPNTRGVRHRQKALSRAPYFILQMVNTLGSDRLKQQLNRPRLHRRNTKFALDTDLPAHDRRMKRYREE